MRDGPSFTELRENPEMKYALITLATAGVATTALTASAQTASFSQNLGDLLVSGETPVAIDTSVVTGDYAAFRVTTDYSVASGDPFSSEASCSSAIRRPSPSSATWSAASTPRSPAIRCRG
jgi:hypothetical protein